MVKSKYILAFFVVLLLIMVLLFAGGEDVPGGFRSLLRVLFRRLLS